jgi:hypothetical protein
MKLLIVGQYDWGKILQFLPEQVVHDCEVCLPDGHCEDYGHPVWDVEPIAPLETLSQIGMRDATRVDNCDMLIAFWDGQYGEISTWISRARIAKKTTLVIYR